MSWSKSKVCTKIELAHDCVLVAQQILSGRFVSLTPLDCSMFVLDNWLHHAWIDWCGLIFFSRSELTYVHVYIGCRRFSLNILWAPSLQQADKTWNNSWIEKFECVLENHLTSTRDSYCEFGNMDWIDRIISLSFFFSSILKSKQ